MSLKTCPVCGTRAFLAQKRCKNESCGWNYSLKMMDPDGSLAASRKRSAADMLAGTPYVPTGPTGAAAVAAAAAAAQSRRIAAERRAGNVSSTSVRGNVTTHSNISAEDDGNMDSCIICGDMGTLLCCDICPLSYHADCAGLSKSPEGRFWSCPQCTAKNLGAAAVAAAAAAGEGARGAGSAGSSAAASNAALLAAQAQAAQSFGIGLQSGLDPFHQRLNACLDYAASECYEVDGYTFQCFPMPLDPNSKAAKERAAAKAATATAAAASLPPAPASASPAPATPTAAAASPSPSAASPTPAAPAAAAASSPAPAPTPSPTPAAAPATAGTTA